MNNKKQLLETFVGVEEHTRVQRRYKYCFYFLSLEKQGLKSQKLRLQKVRLLGNKLPENF